MAVPKTCQASTACKRSPRWKCEKDKKHRCDTHWHCKEIPELQIRTVGYCCKNVET